MGKNSDFIVGAKRGRDETPSLKPLIPLISL